MGLLDGVIGQVIGQMAGAAPPHGNSPEPGTGGFNLPAGLNLPGGLGNVLSGAGGRYAPLVMALLALLANRQIPGGAGGYGSVIGDVLSRRGGGGGTAAPPPPSPSAGNVTQAPGGGGGFLNEIGGMLGGGATAPAAPGGTEPLGGGLGGLLDRLRGAGLGHAADSWVGSGANSEVSPSELEGALGSGTIDALARHFGGDRNVLLQQLTEALPQVIDGLTPGGAVPSHAEQAGWI